MGRYKVGDKFPEIAFQTVYESDVLVGDILKGKTVFWILRYIGCPICRLDVSMIAERYDEFMKKMHRLLLLCRAIEIM